MGLYWALNSPQNVLSFIAQNLIVDYPVILHGIKPKNLGWFLVRIWVQFQNFILKIVWKMKNFVGYKTEVQVAETGSVVQLVAKGIGWDVFQGELLWYKEHFIQ